MRIGFVGMTHLSINTAVGAAEKGYDVVGYDFDTSKIQQLKNKQLTVDEPNLRELFEKNNDKLSFVSDIRELAACSMVYVAPDIPTNDRGESELTIIHDYIDALIPVLSTQPLIILSQVPPGFTRKIAYPHVFYQVETLIFGKAIERTLNPERFIIGTNKTLPAVYKSYLESYGCPIFPMKYESAELAKIAINLFLVSSVSTTNMIAELCEKIGADWFEIMPTLKLDQRIGPGAYLNPGLGISGGNLERDLNTFAQISSANGCDAALVQTWQALSKQKKNWVLKQIHHHVLPKVQKPCFGILGLAYKQDTDSIKNSPSIELISSLEGYDMKAYDPAVISMPDCFPTLERVDSVQAACSGADVILVMTPWSEFKTIHLENKILIDPYGIISSHEDCEYYTLGVVHETHR